MALFPTDNRKTVEAKITALRAMSPADLADIGLKAADVSRLVKEMRNRA